MNIISFEKKMEKLQGICLVCDSVFLSIKYHVAPISSLV